MSETMELTLPGGLDLADVAQWGTWAVKNSTYVPALLDAVGDVVEAENRPIPKWAAVKHLGDISVPILDESPLFTQTVIAGDPMEHLKTEQLRFGNGAVFAKFIQALPKLIAIYTALKPLIS
jgi:hypothetical protein